MLIDLGDFDTLLVMHDCLIEPIAFGCSRTICLHTMQYSLVISYDEHDTYTCWVSRPSNDRSCFCTNLICFSKCLSCSFVLKDSVGETDPRTPMGPADRAPFGSAGGGDRTKSRSRRSTRAVYPASELSGEITLLLLLVWFYYVLDLERERSVFLGYE